MIPGDEIVTCDWVPRMHSQFWKTLIRLMRQPPPGAGLGASAETLDRRARFNNRKGVSARRRLGFRPSNSARLYAALRPRMETMSEIEKKLLFEAGP